MINTAIIGDMHFDKKKGRMETASQFLNTYIIPNKNYKNLIFLGDVYNDKKSIDVLLLKKTIEEVFEPLKDRNIYIILGNHDIYYKNDSSINSLFVIEKLYPNVTVIDTDEIIEIDNIKYYCIPYGFVPDREKADSSDYMLGHIEFYPYYPKSELNIEDYLNYKIIMGHLHKKTVFNDTYFPYIGTPYSMDFNDVDDIKGYVEIINKNSFKYIMNTITPYYLSGYIEGDKINFKKEMNTVFKNTDKNSFIANIEEMKRHKYYFYVKDEKEHIDFFNFLDENNVEFQVKKQFVEIADEEQTFTAKEYTDIIKESLEPEESEFFSKIYFDFKESKNL